MKINDKATTRDYIFGVIGMFLLAMMLCLAITGITPAEFLSDVRCMF
jgi:hypothetical protein